MKNSIALKVTSLLTILLAMFHLSDDIVRGFSPGGLSNLGVIVFLVVWLYATLVLAERRSGLAIILVGSLLSSVMPVIHMTGKGMVGGRVGGTAGAFFFVFTLLLIGVTAVFSLILSARGLWSLRRSRSKS